jgi:hypothetical protein
VASNDEDRIVNQLRAEGSPHRIALFRAGVPQPVLVQNAEPDRRPFIHPIVAPDGNGILTEDAPSHHPWQHGLYVGLNDVNGVGFWLEGLREKDRATDGSFHPQPLSAPRVEGNSADWEVVDEWRAPQGAPLLLETQRWQFLDASGHYVLNVAWSLQALADVIFGQYAYGGLFLRMPFRAERGGTALNSEGDSAPAAEGKRARWVAVTMPLDGRSDPAGMAILDHPQNPDHPVHWRVDSQLGMCPSRSIAGPWRLGNGEISTSRYRLLAFAGPIDAGWIESQWRDFAAA